MEPWSKELSMSLLWLSAFWHQLHLCPKPRADYSWFGLGQGLTSNSSQDTICCLWPDTTGNTQLRGSYAECSSGSSARASPADFLAATGFALPFLATLMLVQGPRSGQRIKLKLVMSKIVQQFIPQSCPKERLLQFRNDGIWSSEWFIWMVHFRDNNQLQWLCLDRCDLHVSGCLVLPCTYP